jgi:hypothetical protein
MKEDCFAPGDPGAKRSGTLKELSADELGIGRGHTANVHLPLSSVIRG